MGAVSEVVERGRGPGRRPSVLGLGGGEVGTYSVQGFTLVDIHT